MSGNLSGKLGSFFFSALGAIFGLWIYNSVELRLFSESNANASSKSIEASEFRLVDSNGKLRAQLATTSDGATALFFFDSFSRNRLNLGVYSKSDQELPFVVLNDASGNAAGIFRLVAADKPYLILKSNGQDRSIFGLSQKGDGFLTYFAEGSSKMAFGQK